MYLKKPEQIGHLNGDRAASGSDDSDDLASIDHVLFLEGTHHRRRHQIRAVHGLVKRAAEVVRNRVVVEQEVIAHEAHALLERNRVAVARVEYARADLQVRQQRRAIVDEIDGEEHRFESLNAALFLYLAA